MRQLSAALVVEAVNEVLGVKRRRFEPVEARTPLADLQLDSLDVAELFMAIEEHSGRELDPHSAQSFETVGDLARLRPAAPANDEQKGTTA
jgi:acyl carrier protein